MRRLLEFPDTVNEYAARVVAAARGVSYEDLERTVEANSAALFGW